MAFITQANVYGVYGQGFDELKFKKDARLQEQLEKDEQQLAQAANQQHATE